MEFTVKGNDVVALRNLLVFKVEELYDVHPAEDLKENGNVYEDFNSYNKMLDDMAAQGIEVEEDTIVFKNARNYYRIHKKQEEAAPVEEVIEAPKMEEPVLSEEEGTKLIMQYAVLARTTDDIDRRQRKTKKDTVDYIMKRVAEPLKLDTEYIYTWFSQLELDAVQYMYKTLKWNKDQIVRVVGRYRAEHIEYLLEMFNEE